MGFAKTQMAGRLTRNPEIRYNTKGTAIASFGIAVNQWQDKSDKDDSGVSFFECVAFGKTAEFLEKGAARGAAVSLSGRLKVETWEDKTTGKNRSKVKVMAEDIVWEKSDDESSNKPHTSRTPRPPRVSQGSSRVEAPDPDDDHDIPF